jgi:hypothetical protein
MDSYSIVHTYMIDILENLKSTATLGCYICSMHCALLPLPLYLHDTNHPQIAWKGTTVLTYSDSSYATTAAASEARWGIGGWTGGASYVSTITSSRFSGS